MHSTLFVTFDWLEKMKVKKAKDAANCPFWTLHKIPKQVERSKPLHKNDDQKLVRRPVWPDLAKFGHFGKILKVIGQLLKALFTIWQNLQPTLANILC